MYFSVRSFLRSPDNAVIDKKHEEVYQVNLDDCFMTNPILCNYSTYVFVYSSIS